MGWWDKAKKKAKEVVSAPLDVWNTLQEGNKLKEDIEQKKLVNADGTPIKGKEHADNYAHTLADAQIAAKGDLHAALALSLGTGKEVWDIISKVAKGQDIRDVLADSYKDMGNNIRGILIGKLAGKTGQDPETLLASLDLDKNELVRGHNNGIAEARKAQAEAKAKEQQRKLDARVALKKAQLQIAANESMAVEQPLANESTTVVHPQRAAQPIPVKNSRT